MVKHSHDEWLETCAAYDEAKRIWEKTGSRTANKNSGRKFDKMTSLLKNLQGHLHPDGTIVSWEELQERRAENQRRDEALRAMVMDKLADEEMRKKLKA